MSIVLISSALVGDDETFLVGVENGKTEVLWAGGGIVGGIAAKKVLAKFDEALDAARKRGEIGEYRRVGGHHVHAKSGFGGHAAYNKYTGFSISQDFMKSRGWDHAAMTSRQRELFDELAKSGRPNTLKEHTRIAVEALIAGGASRDEARLLVAESLRNLRQQGVRIPSRIPWN